MSVAESSPAPAHVSAVQRLVDAGYDLTALTKSHSVKGAVVPLVAEFGEHQVAGLLFQTDYRGEEEYGAAQLLSVLTGNDPRRVQMLDGTGRYVGRFADVNGFVISTKVLPANTFAWGDDVETHWRGWQAPAGWEAPYVTSWSRQLPYTRGDRFAQLVSQGRVLVPELRSRAQQLGLRGLPRKKDELARFILDSAEYKASVLRADVWPAWFTRGTTLVVRADEGPAAVLVDALGDALDAGTFALVSHSGPFHTGLLLFDARDQSPEMIAERNEAQDWVDARMGELEPVQAQLKEWGHRWFFLGKPRERDGVVRYWLNGYGAAATRDGVTCNGQPWGWYTLAELLEEKFVRDCARAEAEKVAAG